MKKYLNSLIILSIAVCGILIFTNTAMACVEPYHFDCNISNPCCPGPNGEFYYCNDTFEGNQCTPNNADPSTNLGDSESEDESEAEEGTGEEETETIDGTTGTTNNPGASNNDEELNLIYPERLQLSLDMPLNQLINALYNFIVWISGLAAFAMFVWGGFDWLTSSGNPTKTSAAREKLTAALTGLLLVLGSYLILRTINPDLTILINPRVN